MILIIDANNLAFRADQTTNLTTKQGKRVGAIFGTMKMLKSYITHTNGNFNNYILNNAVKEQFIDEDNALFNRVVCAWDGGKSAFRKALYPDYKGQREKKRLLQTHEEKALYEAFKKQMKEIEYILPLLGVHSIKVFHYEADDIIYYLSKHVITNEKCIIVSTDKDMLQLVDDHIAVWSPFKKILYTNKNFKRKTGINKSSFVDYRVLVGDSSDNIKGIKGIGDKTAKQLIGQYKSIDNLMANKSRLSKKVRTMRIVDGENKLRLNQKLMDMNNIPLNDDMTDYVKQSFNEETRFKPQEVRKFLYKNQFITIISNFMEWSIPFRSIN